MGSGCILIMATQADWEQAPIIVLPFVADQLDAEHGGSPFLMELLALTGGLQILTHLQLTGQVITDCQSLTRKLEKWDVLRRNTGSPGYPLLRECKRLITPARTIRWTKGHPERSHAPRSGWSQDQWGNYLADLYAGGGPPPSSAASFPGLVVSPPLSYTRIARAAIRDTDWQFITNTHIPMLASPRLAINRASLADYLYHRDSSRASRGAHPRWSNTTVPLAAQAWTLSARGIAQRGAKVRHLWDLRWHGENQAIAAADPDTTLSHCPLCGHPLCSQTHILCDCPGLSHDRAGLHLDLTVLIGQLPRGPCRSLGRAYQHLLFHRPGIVDRGQLWTGLWSPDHRELLRPQLGNCSLREGQRTLSTLSAWATTGVTHLWRRFMELTLDTPGRPLPDLPPGPSPASPGPTPRSPLTSPDQQDPPLPASSTAAGLFHGTSPHARPPPEPPPPPWRTSITKSPLPPPALPEAQRPLARQHTRSCSPPWPSQEDADHG